ncbi:unnamed protein product [Closterium sp. NIES-53]
MATQKDRSSSNGSLGTTPTPPPASGLQTEEGTATRLAAESTETTGNQTTGFDPSMMENYLSFMSFYEQHQQAAPAQSNNSGNNNGVTPMSLDADRDLTGGFRGNRAFASAADEADWDEQNVDRASEEAGPLPYYSVDIPMDDDNPRESANAEVYYDFANNGYVTPQSVDTNVSERRGPNFLADPECDSKDGLSLFNLTSGASTAPAADADNTVRSQWLTRDAAARLAVRNHLPSTERAHFSQYKSAIALYDAVVARYSSPTTAALSRLMLPYLFPDLAAFATVADLVAHLRTSDTRYRAALPTAFLPTNSPPMYITLYYLVTRLQTRRITAEQRRVNRGG